MTEIISVRFKSGGKEYFFNPNGLKVEEGQYVILETTNGLECAICSKGNTMIDEMQLISPLRPVLRIATETDLRQQEENKKKEAWAFQVCQEKIAQHKLEMKLIEVEYSFDGSKILFFFTAEGRVDFRALVKDLAGIFRTRIELRQVGVRDEAKMLGVLGICGRPYCCSSFLSDFHPVSIKMAKTQNLSLNPTKISGACGRLMCCLKYEQDAYTDLIKRAPKQDSLVETPDGVGTVCQVNLLRETSKVVLDKDPEEPKCYHNCDLCVIRNGKGKRPVGYEKPEEPVKEQAAPARPRPEQLLDEPPASVAEASAPAEEAGEKSNRPRRDRTRRERPRRPQQNKAEGQTGEAPRAQQEDSAGQESAAESHRRSRPHNRRHRPSRKGGEGNAPAQS
ncbi:MAG: stage 0 sporulation family protein [Oscillospiraceae bacterium]|nr:stage 0 sporulation family protein [Oscillospiraceae bacterium]